MKTEGTVEVWLSSAGQFREWQEEWFGDKNIKRSRDGRMIPEAWFYGIRVELREFTPRYDRDSRLVGWMVTLVPVGEEG